MDTIELAGGQTPPLARKHRLPLRWYLARLRSMGLNEMVWRARSAASLPFNWVQYKRTPTTPSPRWKPFSAASYPVKLHESASSMEAIELFDLQFPLGFQFDWHRDYRTERRIERQFADMLNIRDTAIVGDVKYVWEPSRHQYLSALAFAADANRHVNYIAQALDQWLEANPYLCGVHWTSSLELAERMISWSLLYPRIANYLLGDEHLRERWLRSIYLHLNRIARKLSLHSSANNHLVGELVGLFVGSSCFDFWPECELWRKLAHKLLEREIRIQVGDDGVNREQAISYHLFTLELFLLAFVIGRHTSNPFSPEYEERLCGMAGFLDSIATGLGDLPWYGDSDDARGFLFSQGESALEVTMQMAALLFDEPSWLRFGNAPTQAARALGLDSLEKLGPAVKSPSTRRELFPDAGLACVRAHDGEMRLLMDFGPLGFKTTAAHGHADALSIWLAIGGEYFLADSGTYAYHSHPEWRTYFRGTSAHNTARVDGRDQSEMAGRFLWGDKAKARLLRFKDESGEVTIEAEHDGYTRLPDPVTHRRIVRFSRAHGGLSIDDFFECRDRHEIELFFHMHEDAAISSLRDGEAQVSWRKQRILFSSPDSKARWDVLCGSVEPKLGWRSRQFNRKQPIPTLRIRMEIAGSTRIRTQIDVSALVA